MNKIKRDFGENHPLKLVLEYYRDSEISKSQFRNVMKNFENEMNLKWITSEYSILYEYIFSPDGIKFVSKVSNELGEV